MDASDMAETVETGQSYECEGEGEGEQGAAEQEMNVTGEEAEDVPAENEPYQDEAEYEMESDDQGENGQESEKDESSEYERRIYVGGLEFVTTADDLKEYFGTFGTVVDATVAFEGKGKSYWRSKSFAFVTMSTAEEASAILQNETHQLPGRESTIYVEPSKPKDQKDPVIKLRLTLTGLDKEKTTKESLRDYFSQFGEISGCSLRMSKKGRMVSRGRGIIKMATDEGTNAVLAANDEHGRQIIDGASVEVKADKINHERFQKLWFGGLDEEKTTESDVREYFSAFGTVKECLIVRDPPETEGGECKSKGYGFIVMPEAGAILRHPEPHKIHDRVLVFNQTLQKAGEADVENLSDKSVTLCGLKETSLTLDDLMMYFTSQARFRFITMEKNNDMAIVALDRREDAEKLAQKRDLCIRNYWLTVEMSSTRSVRMDKKGKNKINRGNEYGNKPRGVPSANPKRLKDMRGRPNAARNPYRGPGGSGYGGDMMPGDGYYEDNASFYGPVKGGGPRGRFQGRARSPGGGWVFVEDLYGQQEGGYSNMNQRPMKGYRNKRQQDSYPGVEGGYGNAMGYQSNMGGGYSDNWGKGTNMNRNKRRGKGRPY